MISLKNVKKSFILGGEEIKALDNISMSIEKGEYISIIGPSRKWKIYFNEYIRITGCTGFW